MTNFYKVDTENLIVAHDDMDLPVGKIRLRPSGSGGGHHGVESIIQNLGGEKNFSRVRIGVGRPPAGWTVNGHVLSPFNDEDAEKISTALDSLVPAVKCIFTEGINQAMNKFNPKKISLRLPACSLQMFPLQATSYKLTATMEVTENDESITC